MRVFVRRRNNPLSTAIVVLAGVVVLGGWLWATRHIPDADAVALRSRCGHLLLPVGLHVTNTAGLSRRDADYLCLPGYFTSGTQYHATSLGGAPPQVSESTTWGPLAFLGLLAAFAAFAVYARASKSPERPQ